MHKSHYNLGRRKKSAMKAKYIHPYLDFDFKTNEIANFDERQLAEYEESLKVYRDLKGAFDTSYEDGQIDKAKEMARASLKEGLSVELISKLTGLSKEEIEAL
jgi:hypothetical protein